MSLRRISLECSGQRLWTITSAGSEHRTQNTEHTLSQPDPSNSPLQNIWTASKHFSYLQNIFLGPLLDQVHLSLGLFWTGSDGLNGSPLISVRPAPRIRSGSKLYLVMSGSPGVLGVQSFSGPLGLTFGLLGPGLSVFWSRIHQI